MSGFLLDTNHLSAAIEDNHPLLQRLKQTHGAGNRLGTCVPVLCELEAGIAAMNRPDEARQALRSVLRFVRVWPLKTTTAVNYGELFWELRRAGRVLSQVDMMVAAMALSDRLTVLSSDQDFAAVGQLRCENWLLP
jgi:predicted nucleic acid-binding protein